MWLAGEGPPLRRTSLGCRMNLVGMAGTVALVCATGCAARSQSLDVMTMPPVCNLPTPVLATPVARLPAVVAPDSGFGAIVGYVADSSGRALPGAQVLLDPPSSGGDPTAGLVALLDSSGAFALRAVSAGRHRLEFRAFPYVRVRDTVRVRPGSVDTLRVHLRFYKCVGY